MDGGRGRREEYGELGDSLLDAWGSPVQYRM